MFDALVRLGRARRGSESLRSDAETWVMSHDNPRVLAYLRSHARAAPVLAVACFSDGEESVDGALLSHAGISRPTHLHSSHGRLQWEDGRIVLPPWSFAWVTDAG